MKRNEYVVHGVDKCMMYELMSGVMRDGITCDSYYLYRTLDRNIWCEEKSVFGEISCGMWGEGYHNDHPCWVLLNVDVDEFHHRPDLVMNDSLRLPHVVEISSASKKYWLRRREKYKNTLLSILSNRAGFSDLCDVVLLYV
jgi:hypothetical protein